MGSKYCKVKEYAISGGSRISLRWGHQSSGGWTYDFAKFSQKTAWNRKNLDPGGRPKFYYVDPLLAIYGVVFLHLLNQNIILNITFCLPLMLKENENYKYFKDALYLFIYFFAKIAQL